MVRLGWPGNSGGTRHATWLRCPPSGSVVVYHRVTSKSYFQDLEPWAIRGGQERPTATTDQCRQPAGVSVDASWNWQACITRQVAPTTIRKPQAQPASFQSTDIGSFDSSLLLRKTHLESPSVWRFRSVKNVGPNRGLSSAGKSQT